MTQEHKAVVSFGGTICVDVIIGEKLTLWSINNMKVYIKLNSYILQYSCDLGSFNQLLIHMYFMVDCSAVHCAMTYTWNFFLSNSL